MDVVDPSEWRTQRRKDAKRWKSEREESEGEERIVFDSALLARTLTMHERSFALFKWVREALRNGGMSFAVLHGVSDSSTAAAEWLRRHLPAIPRDVRPAEEDIEVFARLFVSFLTTSYELSPTKPRLVSDCGCYCSYCTYLRASAALVARKPSKKDFQTAIELKRIYVGALAKELRIDDAATRVASVLASRDLCRQVALATWAAELLRRAEFASQGQSVLALWKEFAWENNRPIKKLRLTSEQFQLAEESICYALTQT
jgi:hypothetical protein